MQDAGPGNQGADAVQGEAPDEDGFEAVVAEDPVGVAERGEGVGAEVGGLQAGGAGAVDVQGGLEMAVQGVEQAVGEALERCQWRAWMGGWLAGDGPRGRRGWSRDTGGRWKLAG
ncbi:hypothetical protein Tdes44962_MAKER07240 [Teratosphaeria destructans]|uniref:Uncharacterized protein n=1 Tax=Teratosphaeria destructans TaxID=418781 RepID=A0A9W7T004_9PEZI|nr:hypothetical protein Tdes44962_MAKER07240 [Teratosphaeria destructans]